VVFDKRDRWGSVYVMGRGKSSSIKKLIDALRSESLHRGYESCICQRERDFYTSDNLPEISLSRVVDKFKGDEVILYDTENDSKLYVGDVWKRGDKGFVLGKEIVPGCRIRRKGVWKEVGI